MAGDPNLPVSQALMREQMSQKEKTKKDELAHELIREFKMRAGQRFNFESHWMEISQRMLPLNHWNFNTYAQFITKGEKRTEFIFDSTAALALSRFASILDSLLTPRNQTWHRVLPDQQALLKSRNTRLYFEEVNRLLFKYRYSPGANFASQNQQNYKSLGAFGTGCIFIDELYGQKGIRYKNIHLSQVFFAENHQGVVDDVCRYFPMTARQANQKWGDNLPQAILGMLKTNPEQEFFFLHVVKPKTDVDIDRLDYMGMPNGSYYISMTENMLLSEGGFNTFPYAISRYEQSNNEVYGRSPAMEVLPAVKTLNEQKKTMLKQGHRNVDPVLLTHDDGIIDNFSLRPGAINAGAVTADGRPLVHALPTGNLIAGKELMDDERKVINDAFLINIFQILTETPEMTATEVLERTKEKGILLAPTIGRQQSEYLGPMIDREIDILSKQGILPPPPLELLNAKTEYKIEYDSPLSRAQRSEEASGLMRTVESAIQVSQATGDPSPLDHFNWDIIVPAVADIQGVPESWLNSDDVVMQKRQQRAQAAQQQAANQAAPGLAANIKAVSMAKKAGMTPK